MIATLSLSLEEFAAKRRGAQDRYADRLRPAVTESLERDDWTPLLLIVREVYSEAYMEETGDTMGFPPPRTWMQELEDTLEKTKGDGEATVDRIAVWLASAVLNVASIEAARSDPDALLLEWVDMRDEDVRDEHRRTHGQVRAPGEPFDVAGTPMDYPGDSRAPIHLWINCRCTLRPTLASEAQMASFAVDPAVSTGNSSTVLVALPAEEDGVHAVGDEQKHATILFLGEFDGDVAEVKAAAEGVAGSIEPFNAAVAGHGVLGPDHAKVLFVEAAELSEIRTRLLDNEEVREAHNLAATHPHFVPHVTITYDEAPAEITEFAQITFDRLAVWNGDEQTEYPLGAQMDDEALTAAAEADVRVPWHGILAPEGIRSGDGRRFKEGALTHRPLPLPLTWQKISDDGHKGNVTVATIEEVEMVDGMMKASGFFIQTPEADEVVGLIGEFGKFGVSVDADDATFEIDEDTEELIFTQARVSSACVVPIPAFAEAWVALGTWADEPTEEDEVETPEYDLVPRDEEVAAALAEFADVAPGRTEDGPGWLTHPVDTDRLRDYWVRGPGAAKIAWGTPGDFNRCRANVAEYVKPQHINGYCANRHYDALGKWPGRGNGRHAADTMEFTEAAEAMSITAAAATLRAPAEWFADPGLTAPTPLTITEDGRVFGHIAEWGTCHIGFDGMCVTPPHSVTDYAYFKTGEVLLDNGESVAVGNLTIGGGHAAPNLGLKPALAHYDSTSAVAADVTVGEDQFGIWFAGWIRPGTDEKMVYALRASALSGDWRKVGTNLELIAALAVNVPGFGIPRPKVAASSQGQVALVAAGIIPPKAEEQPTKAEAEKIADSLAASVAAILEERAARRAQMMALAARITKE